MESVIGFIPAAGIGSRMKGFPICKELLPVPAALSETEKTSILIDNAIQSMINSGIKVIVFVVNDEKQELVHYINRKYAYENRIQAAFVYQKIDSKHYGIPFAIKSAYHLLEGKNVVMRFPDTSLSGDFNLAEMLQFHQEKESELTLGVFSTRHPERLGPVQIGPNGEIVAIEDKPKNPNIYNTWNCIIWKQAFMEELLNRINKWEADGRGDEIILADIMRDFVTHNKKTFAYAYEDVTCIDVASTNEFEKIWQIKVN